MTHQYPLNREGEPTWYATDFDVSDDLSLALRLADCADALSTAHGDPVDLQVDLKDDFSPVTEVDRLVERELRAMLARVRAHDKVLGEEFGGNTTVRGRQWVIDPIDGTENFIRGVPVWATLIALLHDGVPVVGVASAPALRRRWWAGAGQGAFAAARGEAPRRISVSSVADLDSASLSFSSLSGWAGVGLGDRFAALTERVGRARAFGDFLSYCLVAQGAVDIAAEPDVSLWDLAALDILVREAGGTVTDLDGTAGPRGGSVVVSNSLLHDAALSCLSRQSSTYPTSGPARPEARRRH